MLNTLETWETITAEAQSIEASEEIQTDSEQHDIEATIAMLVYNNN